jgi:hypothetical protein
MKKDGFSFAAAHAMVTRQPALLLLYVSGGLAPNLLRPFTTHRYL